MIIQQTISSPVITNIESAPTTFKIKATARAFRILSSFYSDPMMAIPRELGANAWDSHVVAGNVGTPFLVHAPNDLEPFFSIRDYGLGLSDENINKIYTTYFESTKTNDNDTDGCMGLGSKTPFNYTENFTVTSWFNGVKIVYNCFVNERGEPSIMKVFEEATDEHNGLEVKFAVKKQDIQTFVAKIRDAYASFRYRPTIVGAVITYPERKYVIENAWWGLIDSSNNYYEHTRAFMGNYSYPVDTNAVLTYMRSIESIKNDSALYNTIYNALRYNRFHFFFNVGDLEVAPNKEQLQYDAEGKTCSAIVERVKMALEEMRNRLQKEITSPTSFWHAMQLSYKYNTVYDSNFRIFKDIFGQIEVRYNQKLAGSSIRINEVHAETGLLDRSNNYGLYGDSTQQAKYHAVASKFSVSIIRMRKSWKTMNVSMVPSRVTNYDANENNYVVFYSTSQSLKRARVREWIKTNYPKFFNSEAGGSLTALWIIDDSPNFEMLKKHVEFFGWEASRVIEVESLPKPPKAPRVPSTSTAHVRPSVKGQVLRTSADVYTETNNAVISHNYFTYFAETFLDTETYYYVDKFNADYVHGGSKVSDVIVYQSIGLLLKYNVIKGTDIIYAINKTNSHFKKTGTWVNIIDLAEKTIKKHHKEIESELHALDSYRQWVDNELVTRVCNVIGNRLFIDKVKCDRSRKHMQELSSYASRFLKNNYNPYTELFAKFNVKAHAHSKPKFAPSDVIELSKRYKNVFHVATHYYYSTQYDSLADVVNFIDEKS